MLDQSLSFEVWRDYGSGGIIGLENQCIGQSALLLGKEIVEHQLRLPERFEFVL